MADQRYILKPLTNEDGKRGYRLEIDEFLADNEMTNLFLIALAETQKDSLREWNGKPDWLTYYSLSGIHGYPRDDWNGYPNNVGKYGYCHHSQNTFPTWHRPYMLLFESVVHAEMVKQANSYPDVEQRRVYLDAAARFRLPYWDLIMPRNEVATPPPGRNPDPTTIWGCPEILKAKTVFVKLPKGDPAKKKDGFWTISNPLASFTFPKKRDYKEHPERNELIMSPAFNPDHTCRVPTPNSNKETDDAAVDLVIQRQAAPSATMIWQMLNPNEKGQSLDAEKVEILVNEERSWESFANDRFDTDPIHGHSYATVSLESFHDDIHVLLGTGNGHIGKTGLSGHMGTPALAAYDPLFWLHHNNIERLLGLQQALQPKKYTNAKDSKVPLYPFMTGEGKEVYASKDALVKNYWGSGFAMPGDEKPSDPAAVRTKVTEYLTKTYYWATNVQPVPGSLEGWPKTKNVEASWALRGSKAVSVTAPALHISALAMRAGIPELVARKIPLHASAAVQDTVIEESKVIEVAQAVDSGLPDGALTGPLNTTQPPPIQVTWNAHVRVRKFAFNGSFSIHLFIGHVKDNQPERYMTKKNEAGFTGIFASSEDSGCASCAQNQEEDILVEDVVPLTTILYDYLDANPGSDQLIRDGDIKTIPNLEPQSVVPFLKEHLQWRIIDLGAQLLVGQEQQARLDVTVTSRQFLPPTEGNLMGVYGPYTPHPDVTSTKPGGAGYTYPAAEL